MNLIVRLNPSEIAELDRQHPSTKAKGGWQGLLVNLQDMLDRKTGRLVLSVDALDRIRRCAFQYRRGGWQARLMRIFRRTLGPNLDGRSLKPAA